MQKINCACVLLVLLEQEKVQQSRLHNNFVLNFAGPSILSQKEKEGAQQKPCQIHPQEKKGGTTKAMPNPSSRVGKSTMKAMLIPS